MSYLEFVHHVGHGVGDANAVAFGEGVHKLVDGVFVVKLGFEDYLTHVVEDYHAKEFVVVVEHGENVAFRRFDGGDEVAELVAATHYHKIRFYEFLHVHQLPSGLVLVVGEQVAVFGKLAGVDGVPLKRPHADVSYRRRYQQRCEKSVAAGYFCNKEGGHQWCVHHACHHACHSHKGEIGQRQFKSHLVEQCRDEKAAESANHQRRTEGAAHAATADGYRGGHGFQRYDTEQPEQHNPRACIGRDKETVGYERVGVAVEQVVELRVTFAEEGRTQEN